ncbi:hypothetical protein D3C81_2343090 [compost metagenome]
MQAGQQNAPVGPDQHFATHGLEAGFELADDTALFAERQIRRAIRKQAGQTEAAAARGSDLGRDEQPAL